MEKYLASINNFFENTAEQGVVSIEDGVLSVRGKYLKGQYIRIMGSILNDGVYKIAGVTNGKLSFDTPLQDEEFDGIIVGLRIPNAFIELTKRIDEWVAKMGIRTKKSESIPNLSSTWKDSNFETEFGAELAPYRKMSTGSRYDFLRNIEVI